MTLCRSLFPWVTEAHGHCSAPAGWRPPACIPAGMRVAPPGGVRRELCYDSSRQRPPQAPAAPQGLACVGVSHSKPWGEALPRALRLWD